jgi:hypothetical protein
MVLMTNKNTPELLNGIKAALDTCQFDKAGKVLSQALNTPDLSPNEHSQMLSYMHYLPGIAQQTIFNEHIKWAKLHAPIEKAQVLHENEPEPGRRLRIGYISPNFRMHGSIFFSGSIIYGHNRQNVEVYGYGNVAKFDQTNEYIKGKFDHYRNIYGLDVESLVTLIKDDKIDILVELTGHNAGNSLAALAYKPAPIQVSYLSYPGTTGMPQIDYRMVDNFVSPPELQKYYTEELVYLPNPFCSFNGTDLPLTALPVQDNGFVTFGSFVDHLKINPEVIALWSEILKTQNGSRLLLRFAKGDNPEISEHYFNQFEKLGIERSRIDISGTLEYMEHLKQYQRVDIALDTFPYNGHTTTCEALWMGVPVISLFGETFASRLGLCMLKAIGLDFFAAQTKDEYIKKAVSLAQNIPSLAKIRASMRARMQAGTIGKPKTFAAGVEEAYRKMWQKWCLKQKQSGHTIKTKIMENTKKPDVVVESKAKRGILYMIWGDDAKHHATLQRSIDSVKQYHPELPIHVEKLTDGGKINKTRICNITPFDETLFLDNDTIVMDRLDFGFEKAKKHGLACVINECPWARRYSDKRLNGDMVEYNSGVLFYTKQAKPLFDTWNKIFPTTQASIYHIIDGKPCLMPVADQGSFALAFHETGFLPFVLPINWNFRAEYYKRFCGPLKIWHSYCEIPPSVFDWNKQQSADGAIMQFITLNFGPQQG